MRAIINHIIQLQELSLIREEKKQLSCGEHLEQLDASIKEMSTKLPSVIHELYSKLAKKDHIVIAPIAEGFCALCRVQLPISLVQAVRLAREIHSCPQCARMLYYPEFSVKRLGKAPRRTDPQKIGIARFSSQTLMIPKLEATDMEGAIRELATKMHTEGFVDNIENLVEKALGREQSMSTAIDHGLAYPHARGVEGGGLALALGLSPKGIEWAPGNVSKIIFFFLIPTSASAFYIKLLSGLTETFMKPEARKALMAEKEQEKLWKLLVKLTRSTVK